MRFNKTFGCIAAGLLIAGSLMAQEADKKLEEKTGRAAWMPSLELSIDHSSRYISEGNVGNPDPINTIGLTASFELSDSLSIHVGGVAVIDETDACGNEHNVEEWDWLAGVTFKMPEIATIGALELKLDYIYYNYPRDKSHRYYTDTKEYELDVNAADLFLSPGFAFVHDFENDVIKANLNATYEHSLEFISDKLSFECPVELWFGNHQYTECTKGSAVYSLCIQPTLNYEISENVSIGAYLLMGWAMDGRVRRAWEDDENNNDFNVCWGLNMTASF